ncbi:MAG: hypothetical protein IT573_05465 [Deltaproteobacteria bacterium]|nr:hypothetical protein [Deltaproteobacteria bacterium]
MNLPAVPTPGVVKWYRFYCAVMIFVYTLTLALSVLGLIFAKHWMVEPDAPPWLMTGYMVFLGMMSLALIGVFVATFFLPRSPGAWIYHIILICLGLSSPCFIPICVPLLIYWLQPPAKAYYGRD